ncbi:MAG: hypothetical protein HY646_17735 [Acidobacteria bacterium]|nr:hypothetical protein [Acidobacteriota bacterium]
MKMSKCVMRHLVAVLSFALVFMSMPAYASGSTPEELRHEAFVRGGNAIGEALKTKAEPAPLVSAEIEETIPEAKPPAPAPQEQRSMSKLTWAALISGFVVSGILIYHYATGPGASVRNCSTCN